MSRIGKLPIPIPSGVTVTVDDGAVSVTGPQGTLQQAFEPRYVSIALEDGQVLVRRERETKAGRARHGLYRSLIANMVQGVQEPYKKALQLKGLGYKANLEGNTLVLDVGYAEPKSYPLPDGVQAEVSNQTDIVIQGADKQKVGMVAAAIRAIRKPEPYNGTGIRYRDEHVRQKAGKLAA
jgi:large subunit ribosomal protein L6